MKQCTYEFKKKVGNLDNKYKSYEDLITAVQEAISNGNIQVTSDIVFSQSKKIYSQPKLIPKEQMPN